jgi:hypothetical protein
MLAAAAGGSKQRRLQSAACRTMPCVCTKHLLTQPILLMRYELTVSSLFVTWTLPL